MGAMRKLVQSIDKISDFVGRLVSVLLPAMVLVLAFEVVVRYFFNRPTIWVYDTAIFMFGYCGLFAGAYVLKRRQHINVDLVFNRFSPRGQSILNCITGMLFFFFITLVIVYGLEDGISAWIAGDRRPSEWGPPVGHFKLAIPAGASLLMLQGLANWIRDLHFAITGKRLD